MAQGVVQAAVEAGRKRILEKEASKTLIAMTSCFNLSGSSGYEALLNLCVASAAAEEARVEPKERIVDQATNSSGPSREENKCKRGESLENSSRPCILLNTKR